MRMWLAPVGTAFPDPDAEPNGSWSLIGQSGERDYTEDGIKVRHPKTIERWRGLGSPHTRKMFITQAGTIVEVSVADLRLEMYRLVLNGNAVASDAGVSSLDLKVGHTVAEYALMARGASPYAANLARQYNLNKVAVVSEPEVTSVKAAPGVLLLTFEAMEDSAGEVGELLAEDGDS
jgi:hypothetical protein